jgi:hypothetical protein
MSVADLVTALRQEAENRAYVTRVDVLDQTANVVKARLYISSALFVQVYRNDRFNTTNLALIHNGQRIYARDQLGGAWHRHTIVAPQVHDTSTEGCRPVNLSEFLDEVEAVLAAMDLP